FGVSPPPARPELGDPGGDPEPLPDRAHDHVEEDDGGGQGKPPHHPPPQRNSWLGLHPRTSAFVRRCSTSRTIRADVSSIESSVMSITGHPSRRCSASACSSSS